MPPAQSCGEAALERMLQRDAEGYEPRMTFNLIESRYTSATPLPDLRVPMPVEHGDDGDATLEDNEVDQIRKAMHDCHPNVIEHDWKPEWLLLDGRIGHCQFVRELVPESSAACFVPGECCRDIELCRSPNEQARHYAPRVLSS